MKNFIYILFIGIGIFITSCDEAGLDKLFDEDFIELDAATTVTGDRTYSYLRENDGQGVASGFMVNLGARQKSTPVNYTFSIDPASTAIENLHYTVQGTSGTIPANSNVAELPITILDDNINPGEVLSIIVTLTNADITVHPEYNKAAHLIQVTCPSDLAGTYSAATTGTSTDGCCPGEVTTTSTVTLTDLGGGSYLISDWSGGIYFAWYEIYGITAAFVNGGGLNGNITDVCGTISGSFGEPFGTGITLTGSVNEASGVITYSWVNGYDDQATVVLTPQ